MKRLLLCLVILGAAFAAQDSPPAQQPAEEEVLRRAVSEGSTSTIDLIRVLEAHLAKYPDSSHRSEIERALVKAAIETKDERRIALYGERVLAREPDDLSILDRVTRALLKAGDPESSKRALKLAQHYEQLLRGILAQPEDNSADKARRNDEVGKGLGRALLSQAIATGNTGDAAAASQLARKSFEVFPSPEAAAEMGRRAVQLGKTDDALQAYADAFTLAETEPERGAIRRRLGELYTSKKGSETGLGDLVLKSYDRTSALLASRKAVLREIDPNTGVSDPMDFTLHGLEGDNLRLTSLRGKAVVLDFWATWCGPCRAQHPLYEEVKKRFAGRDDVVFLAINTDEDHELVKPFLAQQGWTSNRVYFEDGLSKLLRVSSIPTTVVFSRHGAVVSRMNGFDPQRFVDMLSSRIEEALK
jgi:thiol-disulfide isomerase/thioredoxin